MKYINQLDYKDVPYLTDISNHDSDFATFGTVSNAGCGICCLCMMVENLTGRNLPLDECIEYAYEKKANMRPGTDMALLGPFVAQQYDLLFIATNDIDEVVSCVKNGGYAIANTRGDQGGYKGLFSNVGHFVLVVAVTNGLLTVLDPSYRRGKYGNYEEEGTVKVYNKSVYCDQKSLEMDCLGKDPSYYTFTMQKREH